MRLRTALILVFAALMLSTTAATATAAKPHKPPKPTTTTEAPLEFWTCQARHDNGATAWSLGAWDGSAYIAGGLPSCIDISRDAPDHRTVTEWTVVWSGETQRGSIKGLKLVFEEQVHANTFAETVVSDSTGVWCPSLPAGVEIANLVFVAMPRSGDKWTSFEVSVTPGHQVACTN